MSTELKVGMKAKHSDRYIRMLRGHHRERAEKAIYRVVFVNDLSVRVVPWDSDQQYGTQFARGYMIPVEEQREVQMFCRYCQKETNKDMPDVEPDYDNVTNELIGYRHVGCNPDADKTLSSQTPSPV